MRTLFCYGTTFRTHHQCMAGREDKVFLRVMSCSLAQVAAGSTRTGWFRQSGRAFRLPGRPGVFSSVSRCSASCMVATWLTSRWFRLAPARRRRSQHSGGVRQHGYHHRKLRSQAPITDRAHHGHRRRIAASTVIASGRRRRSGRINCWGAILWSWFPNCSQSTLWKLRSTSLRYVSGRLPLVALGG